MSDNYYDPPDEPREDKRAEQDEPIEPRELDDSEMEEVIRRQFGDRYH